MPGAIILARVLLGGRISLMVGVISTLVSLVIGISVGAIAGYLGGRVDEAIMRFVDVLYSIPYMMVVIVLLAFFGGRSPLGQLFLLFFALGAVSWLTMARIVRGQVMSLKIAGVHPGRARHRRVGGKDHLHGTSCPTRSVRSSSTPR